MACPSSLLSLPDPWEKVCALPGILGVFSSSSASLTPSHSVPETLLSLEILCFFPLFTTFSHYHVFPLPHLLHFFSHYFPLFTTFSHYLPSIFHPLLDSLCPPTPGRAIRAKHAKQNWGNSHIPTPGGFTPLMSHFPRLQTSPDPTRPPNQRFGTPWAKDKARPA